jgi:hypothetical protein
MLRRYLTALAAVLALGAAAAFAPTAVANSYSVAIGGPGFAVGYSNHGGYGYVYSPPPAYYPGYYAPAPYYSPYYYGPTVVYGGYYRPYGYHRHYYRHW